MPPTTAGQKVPMVIDLHGKTGVTKLDPSDITHAQAMEAKAT